PRIFTMAHELKHHLADRDSPGFQCQFANVGSDPVEIGAEVFAAELIFPEEDFAQLLATMGVPPNDCTAEQIVHVKHRTRTTLSYQGLVKRAEFLQLAPSGTFT